MYLLYLDGSGSPDIADASLRSYVLLGLSIHEGNWFALEKRVAALKGRYEFPGVPLELHAKEICASIVEQDQLASFDSMTRENRRSQVLALQQQKLSKKTGPERDLARARYRNVSSVIHLSRAERSRLYEDALDLVGTHAEVRLFAEIVDKPHLLKTTGRRNSVGVAFEQVLSRFDMMLQVFARSGYTPGNADTRRRRRGFVAVGSGRSLDFTRRHLQHRSYAMDRTHTTSCPHHPLQQHPSPEAGGFSR